MCLGFCLAAPLSLLFLGFRPPWSLLGCCGRIARRRCRRRVSIFTIGRTKDRRTSRVAKTSGLRGTTHTREHLFDALMMTSQDEQPRPIIHFHPFTCPIMGKTPNLAHLLYLTCPTCLLSFDLTRPGPQRKPCCAGGRGLLDGAADSRPRHCSQEGDSD